MGNRWLLPAVLTLGVIALVAVRLSGPTDITTKSPPAATVPDNRFPLNIRWRVGVAQQYRLLSESAMHMEAATSSSSSIGVQLHGLLDTLTLEAGHDEVLVGMRLSSVELKINDTVDTGINSALSAPFRVRFASDGMPVAFEFPAEVSTQNRKMLENLVRMFQVSIDGSDTWVAQESNGNGSYEAIYSRSGPLQIDKTKRNFSAPPASMMAGAEITSTEQLRIDPAHDWIIAMSVDEKLKTAGAVGPKMTISNRATLELQPGVQLTATPDTWRFKAAAASVDDTVARITQPVPDISAEEARKQIQSTIHELDKTKQGRIVLIHRLRDLLRVDESMPAVLLNILQMQQLSDRTRADLYLVFEAAGTNSAQAALVSVFTDNSKWSVKDIVRAIVAMGGVDKPNSDSIAALWSTTQNDVSDSNSQRVVSAATFALGSLGNTMNASSNLDYDSLRSSLLNNALSGGNDKQRSDFVFAVGNTQDSTLAHEIVGLLDDDAPSVRRATALSLGMLGIDQTADTLVSRYQQENNSQVRSAIAESLQSWAEPSDSAMAVFRHTVRTEADESARYNIVVLLGENLDKFPENESVLREIMRNEPSKRIRQKVAEALSVHQSKP
jgi:HEAT repeat protein